MIENENDKFQQMTSINEIYYWIGNPQNEILSGSIFLRQNDYKNNQKIMGDILICIAIPNSKQVIEFLEFLKKFDHEVNEIKVLKTQFNSFYSVIMKFLDNQLCQKFYNELNGKKYNEIEDQLCILREVQGVTINVEHLDIKLDNELELLKKQSSKSNQNNTSNPLNPQILFNFCKSKNKQGKGINNDDSNCAICFENLIVENQSESKKIAIISILCGHYFHQECIIKWKDTTCPLCRYHQQPPEVRYCEICNTSEALWMCLLCGSINCGLEFSQEIHMSEHFKLTQHNFAIEIETQFVYDNSNKQFVHRLILNQLDGKIVQLGSESEIFGQEFKEDMTLSNGKLDLVFEEQQKMMQTQLDEQQDYFQNQYILIKKQNDEQISQKQQELEIINKQIQEDSKILEESLQLQATENQSLENLKEELIKLNDQKKFEENYYQEITNKKKILDKEKCDSELQYQQKLQNIGDLSQHFKLQDKVNKHVKPGETPALLIIGDQQKIKNKKKRY